MPQPPDDLDARIRARIAIVVRMARVTAHELGGTMLPSLDRPSDIKDHADYRRLRFQCSALADHLVTTKNTLDMFRAGDGTTPEALPFDDWWSAQHPLITVALDPGFRLHATGDIAGPLGPHVTRGVTLALLAATLNAPEPSELQLELSGTARCPALRVTGLAPDDPSAGPRPDAPPPVLVEHWAPDATPSIHRSPAAWALTVEPV